MAGPDISDFRLLVQFCMLLLQNLFFFLNFLDDSALFFVEKLKNIFFQSKTLISYFKSGKYFKEFKNNPQIHEMYFNYSITGLMQNLGDVPTVASMLEMWRRRREWQTYFCRRGRGTCLFPCHCPHGSM